MQIAAVVSAFSGVLHDRQGRSAGMLHRMRGKLLGPNISAPEGFCWHGLRDIFWHDSPPARLLHHRYRDVRVDRF
jgi:hypothetical protein